MIIRCAWCVDHKIIEVIDDGNPMTSHGICDEHFEEVLRNDNAGNPTPTTTPDVTHPVIGPDPRD